MLPNGGNRPPLSMADINGSSGFSGRGNNLNAYRGTLFYRPDNSTGYFPAGAIAFTDFYSTQAGSPVVADNSGKITSGSSITLPTLFNKLYVTVYGGGGGGGGGCEYKDIYTHTDGSGGATGGTTIFGVGQSYALSAPGGGGGGGGGVNSTGGTGANGSTYPDNTGIVSGGGGGQGYGSQSVSYFPYYFAGSNGGSGGAGGKNYGLILDIDVMGWSSIKNYYGASIPIQIGSGGAGGQGGIIPNYGIAGNGGTGASGYIYISWT
jgi:hypothetical protein